MDSPPGPGGGWGRCQLSCLLGPAELGALCLSPGRHALSHAVPMWHPASPQELSSPACLMRPGCDVKALSAWSSSAWPFVSVVCSETTLWQLPSQVLQGQAGPDSGQGPWDPQAEPLQGPPGQWLWSPHDHPLLGLCSHGNCSRGLICSGNFLPMCPQPDAPAARLT